MSGRKQHFIPQSFSTRFGLLENRMAVTFMLAQPPDDVLEGLDVAVTIAGWPESRPRARALRDKMTTLFPVIRR